MNIVRHLLITMTLATLSASALADIDQVRQRGKLIAAVPHVPPEYLAGIKFRTPEGMEAPVAAELARRMRVTESFVGADAAGRAQLLASGKADVALGTAPGDTGMTVVPTGYASAPMAIMRTDTNIKSWDHLRDRSVCVSENGLYKGTISAKYGATEVAFKAPADMFLALRTGKCDAAVHDSALLEELLKLPEWKKFSARLPAGPSVPLVIIVPANAPGMATFVKQATAAWQANGFIKQLVSKTARQIAFEVYLDQDVPDCH